jgi:hypothetical protein
MDSCQDGTYQYTYRQGNLTVTFRVMQVRVSRHLCVDVQAHTFCTHNQVNVVVFCFFYRNVYIRRV